MDYKVRKRWITWKRDEETQKMNQKMQIHLTGVPEMSTGRAEKNIMCLQIRKQILGSIN